MIGIAQFRTTQSAVEEFVANENLTFPNIYDPAGEIARHYAVDGVPNYVLLDREGRIAGQMAGARGAPALRQAMMTLRDEG